MPVTGKVKKNLPVLNSESVFPNFRVQNTDYHNVGMVTLSNCDGETK